MDMAEKVVIRPMTADDFDAVKPLMYELHKLHSDERPDYYAASDDPLDREVFERWFGAETCNCVAEVGGKVAGFFTSYLQHRVGNPLMQPMTHFYVENFCVAEWAQRKGVGRALIIEAERLAQLSGADRLTLSVWAFNRDARDFYAAMGFSERVVHLEKRL